VEEGAYGRTKYLMKDGGSCSQSVSFEWSSGRPFPASHFQKFRSFGRGKVITLKALYTYSRYYSNGGQVIKCKRAFHSSGPAPTSNTIPPPPPHCITSSAISSYSSTALAAPTPPHQSRQPSFIRTVPDIHVERDSSLESPTQTHLRVPKNGGPISTDKVRVVFKCKAPLS
jgi:hypothetical protein